jgi:hypothetical protein
MMLSRMLDVFMSLLFSSLLLLINTSRIKVTCLVHDFFGVIWKFFGFNKHRFSALHGGVLCGYLLWCCLQRRFVAVCYHSNQLISIGGELNDFY